MATQSQARPSAFAAWRPTPLSLAWAALGLVLLLQVPVIFGRAVNWDEFFHYSLIYKLDQGTLTDPLQTLFTRFFGWAIALPGNGIDHIVAIRVAMFGCELVTVAAIIGLASRFADRTTAVLCALAYVSAGYVFRHGTSFRFDPPTTALLMSALYLLLTRRLDARWIGLIGLLLGLAGMWTMKAVLYLPAFAGILWLRWSEHRFSRDYFLRAAAVGCAALLAYAAIFYLHSRGLGESATGAAEKTASLAGEKMFSLGIQPYWRMVPIAAMLAPILALLIVAFPFAVWKEARPAPEKLALLGLFAPLSTLLFYHNTAPYYYVYMLAPVCVACCVSLRMATARYGIAAIAGVLALNGAILLALEPRGGEIGKQRELLDAADTIFPEPVSYFDSYAMLGHFHKANAFMTPWGTEKYLNGILPSLRETLEKTTVPLVIDDDGRFALGLQGDEPSPYLLPEDAAALRATYQPFWGPFWVAGKAVSGDGIEHAETFLVPGPYTVHGGAIMVDGQRYQDGAVIALDRGEHRLQSDLNTALVWGRNLKAPANPPPAEPYWTGF